MRIIAGEYKGRVLTTVPDNSVRPATDRVKSTIFNMLQNRLDLNGANVLDLFAGSGSLGFEALSRGAENVVFVESSSKVAKMIEENITMLKCADQCDVVQTEALTYMQFCRQEFDLIFADPPYAWGQTAEIPELIFEKNLLKKDGFLIIEHIKHVPMETTQLYKLAVQKEFGQTRVSFIVHPDPIL